MVCRGKSSNFTVPKTKLLKLDQNLSVAKVDLLPSRQYCGYQHSDDYFRDENDTTVRINEFPWVARLIHAFATANGTGVYYECSGSLITHRYVLTAAFCVDNTTFETIGVRLGEFAYKNETDCVKEPPFEVECSIFEDFLIEKTIIHPNYNTVSHKYDIALLRLNRSVSYTDYIRTICLPTPETVRPKSGDILVTAGWEIEIDLQDQKKRILRKLITKEKCIENLTSFGYAVVDELINENSICGIQQGNQSEQECSHDLGGPVIFSNRFQWYQEAIVSYSGVCWSMPDVYTSLANYLEWIKESLEP